MAGIASPSPPPRIPASPRPSGLSPHVYEFRAGVHEASRGVYDPREVHAVRRAVEVAVKVAVKAVDARRSHRNAPPSLNESG